MADKLRTLLTKCQSSPLCVVWDHSEQNIIHAKNTYNIDLPALILPVTTSRSPYPKTHVPVNNRDYGYILVGRTNERRQAIAKVLNNEYRLKEGVDDGTSERFSQVKLCLSVRFYQDDSGWDLNRMAQHVLQGCMPLYEMIDDKVAFKYLDQQGVIKMAMYGDFTRTAGEIIRCVTEYPELMLKQQKFIQQWWSYELEVLDKVLRAFFY